MTHPKILEVTSIDQVGDTYTGIARLLGRVTRQPITVWDRGKIDSYWSDVPSADDQLSDVLARREKLG